MFETEELNSKINQSFKNQEKFKLKLKDFRAND